MCAGNHPACKRVPSDAQGDGKSGENECNARKEASFGPNDLDPAVCCEFNLLLCFGLAAFAFGQGFETQAEDVCPNEPKKWED